MSIEYDISLGIGYRVTKNNTSALRRKREEISHEEPKFDPKTGHPIEPETIIDVEAKEYYAFSTVGEFLTLGELFDVIAEQIHATCYLEGSAAYNGPDGETCIIGPLLPEGERQAEGHVFVSGEITFDALIDLKPEIDRIGNELRAIGIHVDAPIITCTLWMS